MAVVLVGMLLLVPLTAARSVHRAESVDVMPAGRFTDAGAWSLQTGVAFDSVASAQHTTTSIDSGRLTMDHEREPNRDQAMLWATTSETGSSQALGAPDGLTALSQGPLITVEGFDVASWSTMPPLLVEVVAVFTIPDPLLDDTVRIQLDTGSGVELLRTISSTSSAVRYTSTQPWSTNITSFVDLTWEALANLSLTFDYVSQAPDDSRLEVDAIGIRITVQAPLNGIEFAIAEHIMPLDVFPLLEIDFLNGTLEEGAHAPCGIRAGNNGIRWFSEPIVLPPEQSWGGVHLLGPDDANLSFRLVGPGWTDWVPIDLSSPMLPTNAPVIQLKATSDQGCIERIRIDVNAPSLRLQGVVQGQDPHSTALSVWSLRVEDVVVASGPLVQGSIDANANIAHLLPWNTSTVSIKITAVFAWSSNGSGASVQLEVSDLEMRGGYLLEWDEDPSCTPLMDRTFDEDGPGVEYALLDQCFDDRSTNLTVLLEDAGDAVVSARMEGNRLILTPRSEQSGTQRTTITVRDDAGNAWMQVLRLEVRSIDDPPTMAQPSSYYIAEVGSPLRIDLVVEDVDTPDSSLTLTTDRAWAVVEGASIVVTPPSAGEHLVTVRANDGTSEASIVLSLDARAMPDLLVENLLVMRAGGELSRLTRGDIVTIEADVRNAGGAEATFVSVRCEVDGESIGSVQLASIDPGGISTARCDWEVDAPGEAATIRIQVDRSNDVLESEEDNNLRTVTLVIEDPRSPTLQDEVQSGGSTALITGGGILAALAILGGFALITPDRIRKIE